MPEYDVILLMTSQSCATVELFRINSHCRDELLWITLLFKLAGTGTLDCCVGEVGAMPADDVVQAPFAAVARRQARQTPICFDAVKGTVHGRHTRVQSTGAERAIQNDEIRPTADPGRSHLPVEADPDQPQSPAADVVDGRAADAVSSGANVYGRPATAADDFQSSFESHDFTEAATARLERRDVGGGTDEPQWLTARRQYLDNQVLRRQLRCQRADELVAEQFHVVLTK